MILMSRVRKDLDFVSIKTLVHKVGISLRPVTALASFTENEISGTSLEVSGLAGALIKSVSVLVVLVEPIKFPHTEPASRGRCGAGFGGGRFCGGGAYGWLSGRDLWWTRGDNRWGHIW